MFCKHNALKARWKVGCPHCKKKLVTEYRIMEKVLGYRCQSCGREEDFEIQSRCTVVHVVTGTKQLVIGSDRQYLRLDTGGVVDRENYARYRSG